MPPVVIYTTPWCPYCHRAIALLKHKRVEFEQVDVDNDPDKRAWLEQVTGRDTVPQVFIGGKPIGGYDDMAELDRCGQLDPMLRAATGRP